MHLTSELVKILKIVGVDKDKYELVSPQTIDFNFELILWKTQHSSLLECYSIIFNCGKNKILYTSDSNDICFVEKCVNDKDFIKIYCEVGEKSPVHIEYSDLKKINCEKLVLMHFQNKALYELAKKEGFSVPEYLN